MSGSLGADKLDRLISSVCDAAAPVGGKHGAVADQGRRSGSKFSASVTSILEDLNLWVPEFLSCWIFGIGSGW